MRKTISDRLKKSTGIDAESIDGIASARMTPEDHEASARIRIDALEMEEDNTETVELLTDLKETAEDIQDQVDETLENLDDMSAPEIYQAIGNIEAKIENLDDTKDEAIESVDAEAMATDPKAVARVILNTYKTKADNALAGTQDAEGFLDIFKSSKTKLNEAVTKSKTWIEDNNKRIGDLISTMAEKTNDKKDGVTGKDVGGQIGSRLSVVRASNSTIADITKYADSLIKFPDTKSDTTPIDTNILTFVKGFDKGIKSSDFVKAVRIDGKSISYVVLSTVESFTGIREYKTETVPSSEISKANNKFSDSDISLDYAKKLIDTAKYVNSKINVVATALNKESETVENMLKVDINQAKWDKGTGFKFDRWDKFLFMAGGATYGAGLGIAAATGLALLPSAVPLLAGAGLLAMFKAKTDAAEKYEDKSKNFEELAAIDKEKILRARAELTARYGNDAVFGLNNLVNDLIDTASIILKNLKDKETEN